MVLQEEEIIEGVTMESCICLIINELREVINAENTHGKEEIPAEVIDILNVRARVVFVI